MTFVREPAVAGSFYPASPKALRSDIERYLREAGDPSVEGHVLGIVSPHAGYMYSGQVAAYGYKELTGKVYETVVVVAPSHRARFEGAAVLGRGGYRTPLGLIDIDEEFCRDLVDGSSSITERKDPHILEHSLEVQLPFLQVLLGPFRLVPVIIGDQSSTFSFDLARSLAAAIRGREVRCLVVGSTDLSHYYPYATAVELDGRVVRHLEEYDPEGMMKGHESGRFEACGAGPMITTMVASRFLGATRSRVMKYLNSGDVTGDKGTVVGYVSAVFSGD
jgi:AmmeMemoRadiSam system protein B